MYNPKEVLSYFKVSQENSGSVIRQIVDLSKKINDLSLHLRFFKKDLHSKRGLIKMLNKRRIFLNYLKSKDFNTYSSLINLLYLRK